MAVLRGILIAQIWKLTPVPVAPANQEPFVATESLAVIAREAVWAVFERYGAGLARRVID